MSETKEQRIEKHRKFMEDKATIYLKPLMIDILKEKPEEILDFMIKWCETKGQAVKHNQPTHENHPHKEDNRSHEVPHVSEENQPHQESSKQDISKPVEAEKVNEEPQENKPKTKEDHLPSSDEEEDEYDDEDKNKLEKLENKKSVGKKKMGISAEAYGNYNQLADFKAPFIDKSEDQIAQIKKTLGMSFMFKNLDAKDFETVIGAMAVKAYQNGDFVIKQGEDGAELFIVGEGTLKCEKLFPGKEEPTFLKNYQVGEVFGELSLMYNAPRAASIISVQNSVCFSLDRDTFNNIVKGASMKKRTIFEDFLGKIDILSELEPYERSKICDCLASETFNKGDFIIQEGEEGNKFYLIQEGTADAVINKDGEEVKVFEYKDNQYFGELALLNNDKRKASIRVTSDKMTVATLDKNSFKRMLGPIEQILQRNSDKYQKYADQIKNNPN